MLAKFFATFSPSIPGWYYMWAIAFCGVMAIAIGIERYIYIYVRANVNAERFMGEIRKLVSAGDFKKALALCRSGGNKALPNVVLAALIEAERREIVDFRAVQNAVDEAALEIIPKIGSRTGYLATVANVSTLLGLMGTIYGLILTFDAVAAGGAGASKLLAQGIAVAMYTTLFGLFVAIPTTVIYATINTKANGLVDDIDEHSVKLIHLLTGNR
jgi:biopolymer transport protein ExbB/TolQ